MSVVTTVMLSVSHEDPDLIMHLNIEAAYLTDTNRNYSLRSITFVEAHPDPCPADWWGGGKVPQADVFAGAFNHLPEAEYLGLIRDLDWNSPESVQVFFKREDDDRFRVATAAELRGMDLEAFLEEEQ
ncbi:hypothetical protein [Actinocorallia libanotica]|uniref:Uncharacterized protein n=1 Tax=Actinocorallia libanotica TaxID=46162 RepID=A0ABN1Q1G0_9ACTN